MLTGSDKAALEQLKNSGAIDELFERVSQRYFKAFVDSTPNEEGQILALQAKAASLRDVKREFLKEAKTED